jgi:hypothetical protein
MTHPQVADRAVIGVPGEEAGEVRKAWAGEAVRVDIATPAYPWNSAPSISGCPTSIQASEWVSRTYR